MSKPLSVLRTLLLAVGAAALALPASSEDIDIYTVVNTSGDLPNVLLMLDNSANWSASISVDDCYYKEGGVTTTEGPKASNPNSEQGTKMAIEKCALYNVIDALPVKTGAGPDDDAKFNVGLMLLNESPSSDNGGYPRHAFVEMSTNNKVAFKAMIKALAINGDKGNNAAFAKAMYEMFLYFKGNAPYKGTAGSKWHDDAVSSGAYVSPAATSCSRNHIIFIANGAPQSAENNDAYALLANTGSTAPVPTVPSSVISNSMQENWAQEFARNMNSADFSSMDGVQSVTTHTVAVTGSSSDGTFPAFMESMAYWGGRGTYVEASDADTLANELSDIFNSIDPTNSVFASASLPVAVNAQGTYDNQVFLGMFRPDADAKPRWRGNLKQYEFALDTLGNLRLVDSQKEDAVNSDTGFIEPNAESYWTTDSTFWVNQQMGTPPSTTDLPDGEIVEKGGAAQRLRQVYATSQADRSIFTCVGCADGTALGTTDSTKFIDDNDVITAAALGFTGDTAEADRTTLIEWVRGADNVSGDEYGPGGTTTVRPSVHGDVLHSRPAVVNFGGDIGIVAFYGANDGMLHAVNGNQTGTGAGNELWSFIPEELYGKLNRLRTNSPEILMPDSTDPTATRRDYFVDGPIGLYQKRLADGTSEKVVIYVSMRRGGRFLYALDVTTPTAPELLWRRSNSDTGFASLGQTWSEPRLARLKNRTNPVLIFGGGYDAAAEDVSPPETTTMGDSVFVLDAFSGDLIKEFSDIAHSVTGDVTLLDSDFDGNVDRAYAVDLGGNLWRMDFEDADGNTDDGNWSIYKIADLSGGTSSGRKFMFAPDAVATSGFTALMLGSGDREKPLLNNTQDHFFTIFDRNTGKGAPSPVPAAVTWDELVASTAASSSSGDGCYVTLAEGEKVVNAPTTIAGKTYFGTNRPVAASANTCAANLGEARGYAMPLFCQTPASATYVSGGLPPTSVAGVVVVTEDGVEKQVPFVIGAPGDDCTEDCSFLDPNRPRPNVSKPRSRIYWYQETNR